MRLELTVVLPQVSESAQTSERKPDVVLIHGTGSGALMWQPQAELLSGLGHRCFLPDLRGHGKTPELNEVTDLKVHIADLLETLEQSDVTYPAVFIGHSLGAIISLNLAKERGELFEQIFAVAMPGKIFSPLATGIKLLLKAPYERLRGTAVYNNLSWRPRTLIDTERFTLFEILDACKTLDYTSRPLHVSCPVHFAAGRFDPVALHYYVKKVHELLPGSTFKMFEMAGHNFMDMYPEQFNQWLLQYL
ncbi:MAG: alpha/beta hydrolase [Candidatus Obscuribacterales bacterium]|nr:alpha/beta hydrolase [Candidatus Obscuribacterales bacterium]